MKTQTGFAIVFIFGSLVVFGDAHFGMPASDQRAGQFLESNLFQVKYVPGDHSTSFYVVGKKAAQIKTDQLQLRLIVDPDGAKKVYSLSKEKGAFVYPQKIENISDLEIQSQDGQVEKIRLRASP